MPRLSIPEPAAALDAGQKLDVFRDLATPRPAAAPRAQVLETPRKSKPKSASTFCVGNTVCVARGKTGEWWQDGIVVKVLVESAVVDDGLPMPAGAVKVLYDDCGFTKWVTPSAFGVELKHADFRVGDSVSVFCRGKCVWITDGLVVKVLSTRAVVDGGLDMPAGSVLVTYASGDMAKWIPPAEFPEELQAHRPGSGKGGEGAQDHSSLVEAESLIDVDEDAYVVSGDAGVASSILGRYCRVGEHRDRPKYRNEHGAIIFFDGYWKMNVKDYALHWCYEVPGATGNQPPVQTWVASSFYCGDDMCPVPTVARAADVEVCSDGPKGANRRRAIVFVEDRWTMSDQDDGCNR